MHILAIDDEPDVLDAVAAAIEAAGWTCDRAKSAEIAMTMAGAKRYDALVVDRMLPDRDGLALLEALRSLEIMTPAIVLSNLGLTRHRVEGLEAGADDYLAKPFEAAELQARVRAVVRRANPMPHPEVHVHGLLEIRTKARTVHWANKHVDLSPKEFDMLLVFARHYGEVVSRQQLWNEAWPEYRIPPQDNVIDVNLSRLRGKFVDTVNTCPVQTIRGQGFVLVVE